MPPVPPASSSARPERLAIVALACALIVRLALAPMRRLSFDEAYYLCASRNGWPIDDHPKMLGALLTIADRFVPGPIELRVRLVANVLQVVTALGIARLAAHFQPRARLLAIALGTFGILPTAAGLLTTPDAPLLASMAWLFALYVEDRREHDLSLGVLAAFAVLSKVVAIPLVLVLVVRDLRARSLRRALFLATGVALAIPVAWPSLRFQLGHALGQGPAASAPHVGPVLALLALVVGQLALHSPPIVILGIGARRLLASKAVWWSALLLLVLVVLSALVSGRPPEPNWLAPAAIPLLAAAALALRDSRHTRWILPLYVAPAMLAVAVWISPFDRGPFAVVPRTIPTTSDPRLPPYAFPSWRCVYGDDCTEIRAIFNRSEVRLKR